MFTLLREVNISQTFVTPCFIETLVSLVLGKSIKLNGCKVTFSGQLFSKVHQRLGMAPTLKMWVHAQSVHIHIVVIWR